jgi:hypothetical protein
MDERHWLLNTSFSGFVLIAVFIMMVWGITDSLPFQDDLFPDKGHLSQVDTKDSEPQYNLLKVVGVAMVVLFPLLGMFVKAVSIVSWRIFQYDSYAWTLMAQLNRKKLKKPFKDRNNVYHSSISHELDHLDNEPLGTWLRIGVEPEMMSEWRRNRGHYMHFAENSITSTILGIIIGILYIYWICSSGENICFKNLINGWIIWISIILWLGILWKLRYRMHKINNDILLIWMLEQMGLVDKKEVVHVDSLNERFKGTH